MVIINYDMTTIDGKLWTYTEDGDVSNRQGNILTRKHLGFHFFSDLKALTLFMLLGDRS